MASTRRERTTARLTSCAMELFETRGFDNTTVAQIAQAADVSEMTFFRHFDTKDQVVLFDPYDPEIASAIAAQPPKDPAVLRATRGVRKVLSRMPEEEVAHLRRRLQIISDSPRLRAASASASADSQHRIGDQLVADGAPAIVARAAAAAVVAALGAALLEWVEAEHLSLSAAIDVALRTLEHERV